MTLYGLDFVDNSEAAGGDADAVVSLDSFLLIVLVRDNSDAVGGDAKEVVSLVSFSSFFSMVEVGGDAEAVVLLDSLSSVGEDCIAWDSVCLASFSFVSGDFMVVTLLLFDTPTGSKDTDSSSSSDSSWLVDNCIAAFARRLGRLDNLLDRELDRGPAGRIDVAGGSLLLIVGALPLISLGAVLVAPLDNNSYRGPVCRFDAGLFSSMKSDSFARGSECDSFSRSLYGLETAGGSAPEQRGSLYRRQAESSLRYHICCSRSSWKLTA